MEYHVEFTARSHADLNQCFLTINALEDKQAAKWFSRLENEIASLATMPHRCPLAPDAATTRRPIRHLLFGRKSDIYRVIFEILEDARVVRILNIRHAAMRRMTLAEYKTIVQNPN